MARSSGGVMIRYVFTFGFVDNVVFTGGQAALRRVMCIPERR